MKDKEWLNVIRAGNITACFKENGKKGHKTLGYFNTIEEAFNAYKNFKEKYIKQVANEYKDYIPIELYNALLNYQVEITD